MSIKGKEALIIDDAPDVRLLTRRILEAAGMAVSEAKSSSSGLETYEKRRPHVVICDVNMPSESGMDFLRQLRTAYGAVPVPVIMLSGVTDKKVVHEAIFTGASDYIVKPVNAVLLIQKIRKYIGRESYLSVALAPEKQLELSATFPARIVAASEAGFRVTAGIRLDVHTKVSLKSVLLDQLQVQKYPCRSGAQLAKSVDSGQYNNEILLPGVSREISRRIRKLLMTWK